MRNGFGQIPDLPTALSGPDSLRCTPSYLASALDTDV